MELGKQLKSIAISLVIIAGIACKSQVEKTSAEATQGTVEASTWSSSMQGLRASLNKLTPYIFSEEDFSNQKNEAMLKQEISLMAARSKVLNHNPTINNRDPSIRFVASQFSEDLSRAAESFEYGKKNFSRYQLMKVSSYCVECHTSDQRGVEKDVYKNAAFFNGLKATDKAEYLIANRDFDGAFDILSNSLKQGNSLDNFSTDRHLRLMLLIAVRFKDSLVMSERVISMLKTNKNLPPFLKIKMTNWEKSLAVWRKQNKQAKDLSLAEQIFNHASSEIDSMRALNILHKLFSVGIAGEKESEALYLAGKCYEQLNEISPLELHESYYKACIYNLPGTSIAKKCYKSLEEAVSVSYTGSSGVHIPVDVEVWLKEFKKKSEQK